jgi:hypothetical protein
MIENDSQYSSDVKKVYFPGGIVGAQQPLIAFEKKAPEKLRYIPCIPVEWLKQVPTIGATMKIACLLWYARSVFNKATRQYLTNGLCKEWGISRSQKSRAYKYLEEAGLIRVTRSRGRVTRAEVIPPNGWD